jgi:hypothetical protein
VSTDHWLKFVATAREQSIEMGPGQHRPLTLAFGPFKPDAEPVSLNPNIESDIQNYFKVS